jgi:hypothetical protein
MAEPEAHGTPTVRPVMVTVALLSRVPRVILSREELNAADLDHRDYFLVSLLDSRTTIEELFDICGMPSEEALALLEGLARRGVISLDD